MALAALVLGVTASVSFVNSPQLHQLRGSTRRGEASEKVEGSRLPGLWTLGTSAVAASALALLRRSPVALRATRVEWFRKVKRISGDRAVFDVTVKKPMGLVLEYLPDKKGAVVGVEACDA